MCMRHRMRMSPNRPLTSLTSHASLRHVVRGNNTGTRARGTSIHDRHITDHCRCGARVLHALCAPHTVLRSAALFTGTVPPLRRRGPGVRRRSAGICCTRKHHDGREPRTENREPRTTKTDHEDEAYAAHSAHSSSAHTGLSGDGVAVRTHLCAGCHRCA